jgi:hypothetical protein
MTVQAHELCKAVIKSESTGVTPLQMAEATVVLLTMIQLIPLRCPLVCRVMLQSSFKAMKHY